MSNGSKQRKSAAAAAPAKVNVSEWTETEPVRRSFPGPRDAAAPLRIAIERTAYADLVAHAKESLDAEICGVLAGEVCEDDEGEFVHVEAAIRGSSAREASARVTFTQQTWNEVHRVLERDYPKLRMIGWYHSHPGFGVEFSEMDVFIQRNFFPAPTQIAVVTDPLGGEVAICRNTPEGIGYLERFWVDGREHSCSRPRSTVTEPSGQAVQTSSSPEGLATVEARLSQIITELDDLRRWNFRFLMAVFFVICLGITGFIAYTIYSSFTARIEPPRLNGYVPIPIQVGDKKVLLGVGIVNWTIPPELDALYLESERARKAAAAKEGNPQGASPPPGAPDSNPTIQIPAAESAAPGSPPPPGPAISITPPQPAPSAPAAVVVPAAPAPDPAAPAPPPATPPPTPGSGGPGNEKIP